MTFEAPIHISNVMLVDPAWRRSEPYSGSDRGRWCQGADCREESGNPIPCKPYGWETRLYGKWNPRLLKHHYKESICAADIIKIGRAVPEQFGTNPNEIPKIDQGRPERRCG